MFEDSFTTYNMVEPPKIYKDNPDLAIRDIEEYNITKYPMMIDNPTIATELETFPGVVSPFESQSKVKLSNNTSSDVQRLAENTNKPVKKQQLKGSKAFEDAFKKAVTINPEVSKYKDFLVKTAKRESNFNSYIQNTTGAPYYGYFQMGQREIKSTTGLSVEEFRNNPVQQILGAVKLYKMNLKTLKALKIYSVGRERGYSDDALVAGCWMGGPGGVKKYLLGLGDPSDSHWYKKAGQKGGSSVGKIMNDWRVAEEN